MARFGFGTAMTGIQFAPRVQIIWFTAQGISTLVG
jgi:hypothetical protein